jgi:hypothetical protein|tara:strand:- start:2424 stop:2870 length:447 start_codon:yes stop_codon:yes gene_type:complete
MTGARTGRPFSEKSYRDNDQKAKNIIRGHLDFIGKFTNIMQEDYGVDIHEYDPATSTILWHEVEMKNQWTGDWPDSWKEVRIPARKARLLKAATDITFWVIRQDGLRAWAISGTVMTEDKIKSVSIRTAPEGERFFCIPVELCRLVIL